MAADTPTKPAPSDPPAPPPAAAPEPPKAAARTPKVKDIEGERPIPDGRGGYLLPKTLKNLDVSALTPRQEDTDCPECGSPLFAKVDVVRMAQGYSAQGGQKRGVLLVCLGCGEALNGHEVREW